MNGVKSFGLPSRRTPGWLVSTTVALLIMTVAVTGFPVQAQSPAPPQVSSPQKQEQAPSINGSFSTGRPSVVDRFLQQYAQTHPVTPLAPAAPQAPPPESVNGLIRRTPNAVARKSPAPPSVCSIPLTPMGMDPSKTYSIQQIVPAPIDSPFVLRPAAPTCNQSR